MPRFPFCPISRRGALPDQLGSIESSKGSSPKIATKGETGRLQVSRNRSGILNPRPAQAQQWPLAMPHWTVATRTTPGRHGRRHDAEAILLGRSAVPARRPRRHMSRRHMFVVVRLGDPGDGPGRRFLVFTLKHIICSVVGCTPQRGQMRRYRRMVGSDTTRKLKRAIPHTRSLEGASQMAEADEQKI